MKSIGVTERLGEVLDGRMPADEIEASGSNLGFDLKSAAGWIVHHRDHDGGPA